MTKQLFWPVKKVDPFDVFWELYRKYCPRMSHRPQCKKKFRSYSLDIQRTIYKDVRDRIKHYSDWQDVDRKGKRRFMRGPKPYLNSEMWLDPVEISTGGNVRDTTNEKVNDAQQIMGLKKLKKMLEDNGQDASHIDKQIEKALEK